MPRASSFSASGRNYGSRNRGEYSPPSMKAVARERAELYGSWLGRDIVLSGSMRRPSVIAARPTVRSTDSGQPWSPNCALTDPSNAAREKNAFPISEIRAACRIRTVAESLLSGASTIERE